jgi:hypothetical protein
MILSGAFAARVIRNFDDFPEELVRLLLARARVSVAKVVEPDRPPGRS